MAKVYWLSLICEYSVIRTWYNLIIHKPSITNLFTFILSAFVSILTTTIVTMVSIGVESEGPIEVHVVRQVSFYEGFLAFCNIMFGFSASLIPFHWQIQPRLTSNHQLPMWPFLVL
jgi:hypothetical protein